MSERKRFVAWLALLSLVGLVVRIVAVARAGRELGFNDGRFFHLQANFLAQGTGFVDAGKLAYSLTAQPSAQHPPLFPLLLAGVSKVGGESVLAHQLACAVMSSAAIPLIGMTARDIGGSRAGLASAGIAAAYPNLWASDVAVMSESLFVVAIALVLFACCRLWKQPSTKWAIAVGVAIGVAALVRAEAVLLLPFAVVPQCVGQSAVPARRRVALIAVVMVMAGVVTSAWIVRNVTTFDRPVYLSSNLDSVVAGANCDTTYSGSAIGSWLADCNATDLPAGDESVQGAALRDRGLDYARAHTSRVPVVVAARVGRALDLFRPFQGLGETRSHWMRIFGVLAFWLVLPLAVVGAVTVHRRGLMSLAPFLGLGVVAVIAAAAGYGLWRLRLSLDVGVITLAGVGIVALQDRTRHASSARTGNGTLVTEPVG